MTTAGIYVIRNRVNGRVYVGQAVDVPRRWREHRSTLRRGAHHNAHLQASWTLYGEKAFAFEVLLVITSERASIVEVELVAMLSRDQRYNATAGGESAPKSAETRAKMSAAAIAANARMTPAERSDRARRASAARSPERRREIAQQIARTRQQVDPTAHMTTEQLSERARLRAASLTPEQRSEHARKGHETRRRNRSRLDVQQPIT